MQKRRKYMYNIARISRHDKKRANNLLNQVICPSLKKELFLFIQTERDGFFLLRFTQVKQQFF